MHTSFEDFKLEYILWGWVDTLWIHECFDFVSTTREQVYFYGEVTSINRMLIWVVTLVRYLTDLLNNG